MIVYRGVCVYLPRCGGGGGEARRCCGCRRRLRHKNESQSRGNQPKIQVLLQDLFLTSITQGRAQGLSCHVKYNIFFFTRKTKRQKFIYCMRAIITRSWILTIHKKPTQEIVIFYGFVSWNQFATQLV